MAQLKKLKKNFQIAGRISQLLQHSQVLILLIITANISFPSSSVSVLFGCMHLTRDFHQVRACINQKFGVEIFKLDGNYFDEIIYRKTVAKLFVQTQHVCYYILHFKFITFFQSNKPLTLQVYIPHTYSKIKL